MAVRVMMFEPTDGWVVSQSVSQHGWKNGTVRIGTPEGGRPQVPACHINLIERKISLYGSLASTNRVLCPLRPSSSREGRGATSLRNFQEASTFPWSSAR